jgi:hypothetical protein
MDELDDMQDVEAIQALSNYLAVRDEDDDVINTAKMIEACLFALMYFEKLDDESLASLAAAAIKQARLRSAYADAVDFMYGIKGANQ